MAPFKHGWEMQFLKKINLIIFPNIIFFKNKKIINTSTVFEHKGPANPFAQLQIKPNCVSKHVPLLRHGFELQ